MMYRLQNVIKDYAWGSRTAMAELFAFANPDKQPQAEMWLGVHHAGCSQIVTDAGLVNLSDFIGADRERILGKKTAAVFHNLPFLLKILSADQPLSIQVHPNKRAAERGFARENALNIPLTAANRNYKDDNHKPELIYALTEFQALNGFREVSQIIELFSQANIHSLQSERQALAQQADSQGLKAFFTALMNLEKAAKKQSIDELLDHIDSKGDSAADKTAFALIKQFSTLYPYDVGLFAPLLLNIITLKPREAMFLYAETPHAYLRGTGIEIMANSDNVLRAGLTPKHMDVKELLANVAYTSKPLASLTRRPEMLGEGHYQFPVPVQDFAFEVLSIDSSKQLSVNSAEILLCLSGNMKVSAASNQQSLSLQRGQSLFVPAHTQSYALTGTGEVVRAYSGV